MSPPPDRRLRTYKPGQTVPTSGVFNVVHEKHRRQHEVVAIQGEEFPPCRICKEQVAFYVAQLVPHMTHDFDLTGPAPAAMKWRAKAKAAGKGRA